MFVHLDYFTVIGNILWLFSIFFHFGMLYQEKSVNPTKGADKK
jgi:hypothetical protein